MKASNDKMNYLNQSAAAGTPPPAAAERREMPDRRIHSWRTLAYCGFEGRGRRRHARRNGCDCYLDRYDPALVFTGIAVLVMSGMDALFTLMLRDRGAYEANYFMARLMETSDELFIGIKLAVTGMSVTFLLMHAHFHVRRIISGKHLLQAAVAVYGLLIGYELILLAILKG